MVTGDRKVKRVGCRCRRPFFSPSRVPFSSFPGGQTPAVEQEVKRLCAIGQSQLAAATFFFPSLFFFFLVETSPFSSRRAAGNCRARREERTTMVFSKSSGFFYLFSFLFFLFLSSLPLFFSSWRRGLIEKLEGDIEV